LQEEGVEEAHVVAQSVVMPLHLKLVELVLLQLVVELEHPQVEELERLVALV
jgi:hypothetical protein